MSGFLAGPASPLLHADSDHCLNQEKEKIPNEPSNLEVSASPMVR